MHALLDQLNTRDILYNQQMEMSGFTKSEAAPSSKMVNRKIVFTL